MDDAPEGSFALVEALAADLRARLEAAGPIVMYAWTRRVQTGARTRTLMFAKLLHHHRSVIVEAEGLDSDHAYQNLVERTVAWIVDQSPRDE